MAEEFVDGWNMVGVLGEGAFGDVKLLECPEQNSFVAMKCVDVAKHKTAFEDIRKEIAVQRNLDHPNVLKYIGHRTVGTIEYIFLEYAPNGELFDRIEPDVGMPEAEAKHFFLDLVHGLEYLHSKGIAHRDIKPENLLLGANDVLKISDFGFATIFRHRGRERLLDRRCGTLPYVAPEVLTGRYRGADVDIWSAGIVLVAMLTGELPWDAAGDNVEAFVQWQLSFEERTTGNNNNNMKKKGPLWARVPKRVLKLLLGMLCPDPTKRMRIDAILNSDWLQQSPCVSPSPCPKRVRLSYDCVDSISSSPLSRSQPARFLVRSPLRVHDTNTSGLSPPPLGVLPVFRFCSTQPTDADSLLLSTQQVGNSATQVTSTQCSALHLVVRRMTRFVVPRDAGKAMDHLATIAESEGMTCVLLVLSLGHGHGQGGGIITGLDRRKHPLQFRVTVMDEKEGASLLDFRLSKGDGLEFKRVFLVFKKAYGLLAGPIRSAAAWHSPHYS